MPTAIHAEIHAAPSASPDSGSEDSCSGHACSEGACSEGAGFGGAGSGGSSSVHIAAEPEQAPGVEAATLTPGVQLKVYDIGQQIIQLHEPADSAEPNFARRTAKVFYGRKSFGGYEKQFLAEVTTLLQAPADGAYTLRLASDDGSALWIGDKMAIFDDGLHAMRPRDAKVHFKQGVYYPIRILMFQNVGEMGLKLQWRTPGSEGFTLVPPGVLFTEPREIQTTPGQKPLGRRICPLAKEPAKQ